MEIKVFGKFTKRNDYIYRTDTYIQVGESEEIKGSFILCNPGSSRLKNSDEEERLQSYEGLGDCVVSGELSGEITKDATMKQLIKILKEVGLDKEAGKYPIYNIFTLRNGNMDSAIKEIKNGDIDKNLLYKDFEDYKELKDEDIWTLVGWGCKSDGNLNRLKREWLKYLDEKRKNVIGYEHKDSPHYYHPKPQIEADKIKYVDIMTEKLASLLDENKEK